MRIVSSPHCDARPEAPISLIVIHAISLPPGRHGGRGVEQLFTNTLDPTEHPFFETIKDLRVSAHYFIRRTGEVLVFVPPELRAWHAGVSSWRGMPHCNDYSIGIELEGGDEIPFEVVQYSALADVIADLSQRFSIQGITGHQHIAPGRKTDPGPHFSWQRLRDALESAGAHRAAELVEPQDEHEAEWIDRWPFPLAGRPA